VPAPLVGARLRRGPALVPDLVLLLLLEHLPPLAELLGRAPGHLGSDILPLVVMLGLEPDHQVLLVPGQRPRLDPQAEVVLPPLQARLGIAVEGRRRTCPHGLVAR
jgi:hypothetical protein